MPRVKRGSHRIKRRKKILKQTKGYYGSKSKLHLIAKRQLEKSLQYSYRDRRAKKREFRALWILRINSALRKMGIKYSDFIHKLKEKNIDLNRKVLSNMAATDFETFKKFVESV
jgi:large subunit ribosomal protein L20